MLRINGHALDPQLMILDKDGTLLAFERLWQAWFDGLMRALDARIGLDEILSQGLAATLGYSLDAGAWDPLGPLTLAAPQEVAILIAGQLYATRGLTWYQALETVGAVQVAAQSSANWQALLDPIGDVRGALLRFRTSGCRLALATTDDRAPTEIAIAHLDIADLLDAVICGDDGVAVKPAPDMALHLCEQLGVAPAETMMVGDSIADLQMAHHAGLGWAVGVTSGALDETLLAPHADWVLPDIHAIETVATEE